MRDIDVWCIQHIDLIFAYKSHFLRSDNEPKTRGAPYMRGKNIMIVNYQQSLDFVARSWVGLTHECDLYAKIYSIALRLGF